MSDIFMNIHPITIIGIIITTIGTIFLTLCGLQKIKGLIPVYITFSVITIIVGQVFTFCGQQIVNNKSTQQLQDLSKENIKLNKEAAQLARKNTAIITGGDSYCYFLPFRPSEKTNTVDLMLTTEGEYPLYDVSVKIDDVEKMMGIVKKEYEEGKLPYDSMTQSMKMLAQASKIIEVGNLGSNQAMQMSGIKIPLAVDKKSYNIQITARNGTIVQFIRFRKINNQWKMANKVMRNGEVLKEFIDSDFPQDKDQKIDW